MKAATLLRLRLLFTLSTLRRAQPWSVLPEVSEVKHTYSTRDWVEGSLSFSAETSRVERDVLRPAAGA